MLKETLLIMWQDAHKTKTDKKDVMYLFGVAVIILIAGYIEGGMY
jgi:uncharacterized membrane protein SpoIIM required for sporulation